MLKTQEYKNLEKFPPTLLGIFQHLQYIEIQIFGPPGQK